MLVIRSTLHSSGDLAAISHTTHDGFHIDPNWLAVKDISERSR